MDGFNLRLVGQKFRDLVGALRLGADAIRERLQAAQGEPALKGRGHGAAVALYAADLFEERAGCFKNQGAAQHVTVAGKIFGDRVHHYVRAQLERKLEQWRGPCVVTGHDRSGLFGDGRDGANIGNVEQRVGGRFHPKNFRRRGERALHGGRVLHVDERVLEAKIPQQVVEQDGGAVKDIVAGDDVVTGRQSMQQPERGRVAGRKSQRRRAFLERGQSFFQRRAVGIVRARIEKAARQAAVIGLLIRGGKMDGGDHVTGAGFRLASGMDCTGLNFHH